ncbi:MULTISPECIES: RNA polymerase sigma factor [Sphingobacterium]|uniref:RNA polymerase sigma factor n=1 Tax=Sphingobacterium TaxID=28453 RepID=UPI00162AB532|nr:MULTISPECIES: sigma-70 family RNA polymerase sigma factor [Sphingobacterium]
MDSLYIDKVLSGDRHAFSYFISTYKDMAFSIAISIVKNELLAEEVAQESFVQTYLSLKNFKGNSKFSTWFYKIVVHCSYKMIQKKTIQFVELDLGQHDLQFDDHALKNLMIEEQKQMINEVLRRLPSNEALALRLFYLEELPAAELCEITGWTTANCKIILFRARKRMAFELNKEINSMYYGREQG